MLKTRILTALIIGPALLFIALFAREISEGVAAFALAAVVAIAGWEWANLARWKSVGRAVYAVLIVLSSYGFATLAHYYPDAYLGLYAFNLLGWLIALAMITRYPRDVPPMEPYRWRISMIGFAILVPMGVAIWQLFEARTIEIGGFQVYGMWLVIAAVIPIAADTGAYFAGRAFGKRKLAPRVSPNKTWGGFWGGLVMAAVFAGLAYVVLPVPTELLPWFLLVCVVASAISVVGDLTVSLFKRHAGVKDTGSILPGHGGIMDRIDSVAAALPILAGGFQLLQLI